MNAKEVIKLIEKAGWYEVAQKGSHKQFKHLEIKGRLTVPFHGKTDIKKGTLKSILKQAGLK